MADDAPDAATQAVLDAIQAASPSGGSSTPLTTATHNASNAQSTDPTVSGVIGAVQNASPSSFAPPPDGILNRSWKTILDLPNTIATGLTTPPPPVGSERPDQSNFDSGVLRGVRDLIDTGAHGLASAVNLIPGVNVDIDTLRANDKADRDAWEKAHGNSTAASGGRLFGQTVPTIAPLAAVGRGLSAAANLLPDTVAPALRLLMGTTPADSTIGRAGQLAIQGAATGGTQAGLTSSASDLPVGDQVAQGAITGAAAGPVIGGLTKTVDLARGFYGGIRPEVAALADTARQYGVTPPVTSLTTNPFLRQVSDALQKLPFSGADAGALAKQRQFQSAVTSQMGSTADNLAPATMKETADRLSKGYQDLYANAPPIAGGRALTGNLTNIGNDAARYLVGDQAGAMAHVDNAITNVANAFSGGSLDPQAYKSLMGANDGTLARIENVAPSAAQEYLAQIRQAVQDRFSASAGPDAAATLKNLDSQWRAMKTVQPLAAKSTMGDISPGGLMQPTVTTSNRFDGSTGGIAYTGGGPMGDLARVGKQFFGTIPDSGTAGRLQAYDLAKNPISTGIMAIPGMTVGRAAQMWANSPRIAGRMIDTSLGGPRPDIGRAIPYGLLGPIDSQRQ